MRIAVIGAGVVGTTVASHLLDGGHAVTIVETGRRLHEIQKHGLNVKCPHNSSEKRKNCHAPTYTPSDTFHILSSVEELQGCPLDWVFICTKTYALPNLCPRLGAVLSPDSRVVSFQNGVDPEELIASIVGRSRTYRGIINFAGTLTEDGSSVSLRWSRPPHLIGPLIDDTGQAAELAEVLSACGLETRPLSAQETKKEAFRRAILSAALAPICALIDLSMGEAMAIPEIRALTRRLAEEGFAVAHRLGHIYEDDAIDSCLKYLEGGGDHMPSMWWDLAHSSRTEIDAINGRIAALGTALGVPVPTHHTIAALIVGREIRLGIRNLVFSEQHSFTHRSR